MVWFSYHGGHSGQFCRHAKGDLQAVVAAAVERGFTTYGLSEHCPRIDKEHLYPDELDLSPNDLARQFAAYFAEASHLKARYAEQLEILVGFETEVLPVRGWAALMRQLRNQHDFDFIVGSVHSVRGIWIDLDEEHSARAAQLCGGTVQLEAAYFDQLTDVIETLKPEIVGHIDLIRRFRGDEVGFCAATHRRIERVLEAAHTWGAALEINAAPHRRGFGPVYPGPEILKRACEMGVAVTLGDDSHGPADVGVGLNACLHAIAAAGYKKVSYLTRRDGELVLDNASLDEVRPRERKAPAPEEIERIIRE